MVSLLRKEFREVEIEGCRFHLGQAWYRKNQSLGLTQDYKDKSSEIGKWLSQFFGLPFLPPDETEDSFVEEMLPEAPTFRSNLRYCSKENASFSFSARLTVAGLSRPQILMYVVVCICFNTSMNTYIHGCAE
jgi:hypothetical protein